MNQAIKTLTYWRVTISLITVMFASPAIAIQVCKASITPSAPDNRYEVHTDGTVSDLRTGLMWQQCPVGQSGADCATGTAQVFSWDLALQYLAASNAAGGMANHSDWRLPNIKELQSLIEVSCYDPAINLNIFPNEPGLYHWSSTPKEDAFGGDAFALTFFNGVPFAFIRGSNRPIRLVRDIP